MENRREVLIGVMVAGLVIGFIAGWFVFSKNKPVIDSSNTENNSASFFGTEDQVSYVSEETGTTTSKEHFIDGTGSVAVASQPAGSVALVSRVSFADEGWIAIREDRDGVFGNILGARRFPAGEYDNQTVELLRGTVPGQTYYAVFYKDDGDGVFDHQKDPIIQSGSGVVFASFKTTAD